MTYYDNPEISDWQKQVITGTILGGSSLVKPKNGRNCYLFMRSANKDWLNYKADELTTLASQRPFTKEGNTLRWHSNCYPIFAEYYNLFYENNRKKVRMEALDTLRDIGLAIWYGDCGRLKKNNIILNINKFGEDGSKVVHDYFIEVGIGETKIIKEKGYYRLLFNSKSSEKLLLIVANRLPEFTHRKLLPK